MKKSERLMNSTLALGLTAAFPIYSAYDFFHSNDVKMNFESFSQWDWLNILFWPTAVLSIMMVKHGRDFFEAWLGSYLVVSMIAYIIFRFASVYFKHGIIDTIDGNITHNHWDSLYFSVVTWTTLGFGDFRPAEAVRMVAGVQALLGLLFNAILIAAIVAALNRKN